MSGFELRPFRIEDVDRLELEPAAQEALNRQRIPWAEIVSSEHSYSGFLGDKLIGFGGAVLQWPGRAIGWVILSKHVHRYELLQVHRLVRAKIDEVQHDKNYRRIEAQVVRSFNAGHKWMRILGFEPEGIMKAFDHEGNDHLLYAKIGSRWQQQAPYSLLAG